MVAGHCASLRPQAEVGRQAAGNLHACRVWTRHSIGERGVCRLSTEWTSCSGMGEPKGGVICNKASSFLPFVNSTDFSASSGSRHGPEAESLLVERNSQEFRAGHYFDRNSCEFRYEEWLGTWNS